MAGVEIKGFQDLVRNCNYLSREVLEKALQAAEDAAAQVVRQAVESAAPRKTGQLARSVDVFEGVDRKALTGSPRRRLPYRAREEERLLWLFPAEGLDLEQGPTKEGGIWQYAQPVRTHRGQPPDPATHVVSRSCGSGSESAGSRRGRIHGRDWSGIEQDGLAPRLQKPQVRSRDAHFTAPRNEVIQYILSVCHSGVLKILESICPL